VNDRDALIRSLNTHPCRTLSINPARTRGLQRSQGERSTTVISWRENSLRGESWLGGGQLGRG